MKVADHQLDEIFEMINSSADVEVSLRQTCKTNPIVKFYVHLACDDRWIDFDLQDLEYKFSEFHRSLCGAYLMSKSTMNMITEILLNPKIPKKTKYFQTKNLMELQLWQKIMALQKLVFYVSYHKAGVSLFRISF